MILFSLATIAINSIVQHKITKNHFESNSKLRQLREDYAHKRQEQQIEMSMILMREGQQLQLQLQQEMLEIQMKQMKTSFYNELQLFVDEMAYKEWPLKVLPWVIQNQSLGNLLFADDVSRNFPNRDCLAMHCILLPSSCPTFNTNVWLPLESKLEAFCNKYWNSSTGRPVLFYSGSWGRIDTALGKRGIKKPANKDIGMLYDNLNQLPTILIQPDFDFLSKNLKVTITIWGIPEMEGKHSEIYYPGNFHRDYKSDINYRTDTDAAKDAIKDLEPYLESLIGYMADTYFWYTSNAIPMLPSLIQKGVVNTEGMSYIRLSAIEFYEDMLKKAGEESRKDIFFSQSISNLFKGISVLWDKELQIQRLTSLYIEFINHTKGRNYNNFLEMMETEIRWNKENNSIQINWGETKKSDSIYDSYLQYINTTNQKSYKNLSQMMLEEIGSFNEIREGDVFPIKIKDTKFNMIHVGPNLFLMGDNETPYSTKRMVKITKDYYIGETLVTQKLWNTIMGRNLCTFLGEDMPVNNVTYGMCKQFITMLNEEIKNSGTYKVVFRFPTEAEWENAARGGRKSHGYLYSGSNNIDEVSWYECNSHESAHPVAHLKSNELGIYDMSGNLWEICGDTFREHSLVNTTLENPKEAEPEVSVYMEHSVKRGGAFTSPSERSTVYARTGNNNIHKDIIKAFGFRLAMDIIS